MKAAVLRQTRTPLVIEEIEIDNPGPREVLIRTAGGGADQHLARAGVVDLDLFDHQRGSSLAQDGGFHGRELSSTG